MPKAIYIDVCALSRPFDNQDYLRIRLETEAVNLLLSKVREGGLKLIRSTVHAMEIEAIPDLFERIKLQAVLEELGDPIRGDRMRIRARGANLAASGSESQMQLMLPSQNTAERSL